MTISVMQMLHQGGGAGSVTSTLHLSLGLAAAGLQVRFVCPAGSEVEALARAGSLEVHPLTLAAGQRRRNAASIAALLRQFPVDLINSQSARDREALTWLALTRQLRVPFVVTRRQMPRTFFLENWLVSRLAARVVAVSPSVGEELVRRGTPRRKLSVIPNGLVTVRVDVSLVPGEVQAWRERVRWEPSRRTVAIVSRPKDQLVVLEALEQVSVPMRLVLAGVNPESELGRRATLVPPRHAVVCLPFTPTVRPLYELVDLVLLPSRSEGLSQSLLEAMALGKPVIASAAPGNVDVVTHGVDGYLVPSTDRTAWAGAIEHLLGSRAEAERLGSMARITARERFSLAHTIDRTIKLYEQVLKG
jgi:glycosyltransferase involved in cell wall biosynthesis